MSEQTTDGDSLTDEATAHTGHLLGAGDIRRIAADAGISPTKKFGQNFVIDPGTVRRIVREAGVTADTHVLEVGPGLGSLTLALLETGAAVTAVEIDPALAARLPRTIAEFMPEATDRLTVVTADAMSLSPETLPEFAADNVSRRNQNHSATNTSTGSDADDTDDKPSSNIEENEQTQRETSPADRNADTEKSLSDQPNATDGNPFTLVSNLPYNVATPILLTLLEQFDNLDHFLVMVQKEVADRLAAKPSSKIYGTPSVKLAWYGRAERVGLVGRNVFWPAPNVDSALVSFKRYDENEQNKLASKASREKVFQLIDAAFSQRRKTLHAALKKLVPAEAFAKAGIDPTRRGETLTIHEFVALAAAAI
ncbi:rRNA adenine dimethyltransferase family protein [Bifidobacterium sp. ESL0732]|uniref:ribosomal RNA small subunit methyltransferase A n=1 Tax=Bifidobacterium sp. ESL0732 TaxID=2983222 RepID=UPI0023FA38AC|nr:rRNA adenine dimethyltransferase family protein [Bifidobacterium sp. ESL0732]WEV64082.1 rRNA adenine dimethyltransferase family protein [Bifidobacterium sp. ESL0732]